MRSAARCSALLLIPLLLTAILLVIAAAQQPPAAPPDPHASGKIMVPPNTSEIAYCDGCHTKGCPMPHPESVKLTWGAAGRTVLGVAGEVTCGTCHTRGFRHRDSAFLARDQKGLCTPCHAGPHALPDGHAAPTGCEACHAHNQAQLAAIALPEKRAMQPDIDGDCMKCHYDGPVTHPIGMANSKKKAPDLPLAPDGSITCVTCHVGHKEQDKFGQMLRKDNRRGQLCNSCHDDL